MNERWMIPLKQLWYYGAETDWLNALEHYYDLLSPKQKISRCILMA